MSKLQKQQVPTKQQAAFAALRAMIMDGTAKPGERLVIDQLARQLGMSTIPVREAMNQLEAEGLVEIRPHAGAVVSDIPEQAIEEIFAMLEVLETVACRLAAKSLGEEAFAELDGLVEEMAGAKSHAKWLRLNRQFHEAPARLAGLVRLEEELVRVGEQWERLRRLRYADRAADDLEQSNREHGEFVKALRSGDEAKWTVVIRKHNERALRRYLPEGNANAEGGA